MFLGSIYMIDESYPFENLRSAVEYIDSGNPARFKPLNIFEPERGSKPVSEQFSGSHPADIHASVVSGFEKVVRETTDSYTKVAAVLFWRGLRTFTQDTRQGRRFVKEVLVQRKFSVEEIADELGCSEKKVYRLLREFKDRLESEFIRRKLIKPRDFDRYDA